MSTALFWHRRDLRISDNAGLFKALKQSTQVIPVFIFDRSILGLLPKKRPARIIYLSRNPKIKGKLSRLRFRFSRDLRRSESGNFELSQKVWSQ